MAPTPAQTVGRTLARLGLMSRPATRTVPGGSREAIFTLIASSPEPCAIDDLCKESGLHANTIRTHLEVLEAAGRVERVQEVRSGRGRPRWLYRARPGETSPHMELAEALLDQLQETDSAELAQKAAQRWAETLHPELRDPSAAPNNPDEAVAMAADSLRQLGFRASVDPVGDRIDVTECPYAALVDERPVICDIHAALVQHLLQETGQPVELDRLDVWVRSGRCTAHLRRDDIQPAWVVRPSRPTPTTDAQPGD